MCTYRLKGAVGMYGTLLKRKDLAERAARESKGSTLLEYQ
jgi:hypothetical protein